MSQRLRLVYFGSGAFGLPTLRQLAAMHDVALVVTQPDRPAGRKLALTPTPIAALATALGLPTIKPLRADEPEAISRIHAAEADAFVVIAYGHKLSHALLGESFAINLHASLLPKYRGAAPINWAMMNGETETGVTVITLSQTMDAGDILASRSTPIDPRETAGELHDRLSLMGPELVADVLTAWHEGRLQPHVQDARLASAAPKLAKSDGTVTFDQPAVRVRQRVHGLTPWPGCTVRLEGQPLRLARVSEAQEGSPMQVAASPGTLLADLSIACPAGAIRLLEVQPAGGRVMSFEEYCRGHRLVAGARFEPLT